MVVEHIMRETGWDVGLEWFDGAMAQTTKHEGRFRTIHADVMYDLHTTGVPPYFFILAVRRAGAPAAPATAAADTAAKAAPPETESNPTPVRSSRGVPVGQVDFGEPSSSVASSSATIVVLEEILPGAKRCYQEGLAAEPRQLGTLVLLIEVAPGGQVATVSARSNTGLSEQVVRCTETVVRSARFPAPDANGSTVSVPLPFSF